MPKVPQPQSADKKKARQGTMPPPPPPISYKQRSVTASRAPSTAPPTATGATNERAPSRSRTRSVSRVRARTRFETPETKPDVAALDGAMILYRAGRTPTPKRERESATPTPSPAPDRRRTTPLRPSATPASRFPSSSPARGYAASEYYPPEGSPASELADPVGIPRPRTRRAPPMPYTFPPGFPLGGWYTPPAAPATPPPRLPDGLASAVSDAAIAIASIPGDREVRDVLAAIFARAQPDAAVKPEVKAEAAMAPGEDSDDDGDIQITGYNPASPAQETTPPVPPGPVLEALRTMLNIVLNGIPTTPARDLNARQAAWWDENVAGLRQVANLARPADAAAAQGVLRVARRAITNAASIRSLASQLECKASMAEDAVEGVLALAATLIKHAWCELA